MVDGGGGGRPGSSRILVDSPSKKINLARRRKTIQVSEKYILQVKWLQIFPSQIFFLLLAF